jgi:predicted dehydrogenase
MTRVRLGIVGAGTVGELHAAAAATLAGRVEVTAVVDPVTSAAERLAAPFGAQTLPDHVALIDSGLVDAVIVGSPHAEHRRQVVELAAAGLPVLVEKPMALSAADATAMADSARAHRVPLGVGLVQRHLPTVRAGRRLIGEGAIGTPRLVVDRRGGRYEPGTRPTWFLDARSGPGGIITNLGTHCIDKLFQLTGQETASVRTAWARSDQVVTDAVATLDLEGVVANLVLTGTGLPQADITEVIGDEGALHIDRASGVTLYRRGEAVHTEPTPPDDIAVAFVEQLDQFLEAVLADTDPPADGAYGVAVVRTVEAVERAAGVQSAL